MELLCAATGYGRHGGDMRSEPATGAGVLHQNCKCMRVRNASSASQDGLCMHSYRIRQCMGTNAVGVQICSSDPGSP